MWYKSDKKMDKPTIYREPMGENLFEEEFTVESLSQMGNPLERLSSLVDFEMFRPVLEDVLLTKECKTPAGRKPIDVVLMFKVIFLQRYYVLGDHQIQYQIIDRTSFRQFLGIHTVAEIPDEKTVWACRDKLSKAGTFDLLFDEFRAYLDSLGLSFNEGKIIDATFVEAPRQRNTRDENRQIKEGNGNHLWQSEDGDSERERKRKAHKRSHKDIDARWTKKRGENHYGYKDHIKADKKTKKPTDPRIAYFVWGSSEYSFDKSKPYICGVKHYGAGSSRVVRFNRSFGFNYNGIISPFLPSEFTINYFDGFGAVKYGGKWLGVRFVGKGSDIW